MRPNTQSWYFQFSVLAVAALLAVSLVAAYPQVIELMSGRRSPGTAAGFGLRWLREAVWLVICSTLLAWTLIGPPRFGLFWKGTAVVTAAVIAFTAFVFGRTVAAGVPPEAAMAGLRTFQYVPFAFLAFHIARHRPVWLFTSIARILKALLVVWTPIALYQVLIAPPVQGRTMFGSRAFATFNEANVFGVAVATSALWLVLTILLQGRSVRRATLRTTPWLVLCLLLALLTGSRTALALTVITIVMLCIMMIRHRILRYVAASLVPVLLLIALIVGSLPAISGRRTDLLRDGRLAKWSEIFEAGLQTPVDLLFGWGLGLGSNTVNTLFGYNHFEGQFIADSHFVFVVSSFGLVGVVIFLTLLAMTLTSAPRRSAAVFVVYVMLVSIPFLPFELFPSNVLIMLAWGGLLGVTRGHVVDLSEQGPTLGDTRSVETLPTADHQFPQVTHRSASQVASRDSPTR